MSVSWDELRVLMQRLPGTAEGTSYGTPAFRVGKKFLTRLHPDGVSLVVPVGLDERELLMERDPKTYYITDHYRTAAALLVSLKRVRPDALFRLLEQQWRAVAPKRLLAQLPDRARPE
jgi:hypothetical protein